MDGNLEEDDNDKENKPMEIFDPEVVTQNNPESQV